MYFLALPWLVCRGSCRLESLFCRMCLQKRGVPSAVLENRQKEKKEKEKSNGVSSVKSHCHGSLEATARTWTQKQIQARETVVRFQWVYFTGTLRKSGNTKEDFFAAGLNCGQSVIRRDCRGNETEDVKRKQHWEGGWPGELLSGEWSKLFQPCFPVIHKRRWQEGRQVEIVNDGN